MADSREIVLAGKTYNLTVPLTLGQLIDCNVGLAIPKGKTSTEEMRHSLERSLHVLSAALIVEHPEMSVDALRSLRGASMSELTKAAMMVLEVSGLVTKGEPEPGEVTAEAALTGNGLSDASAQP